MKKSASIVIGLGFGDEGKGLMTDNLCRRYPDSLVVRFSGGHQAGHTVVTEDGTRHVFSSFGSGTLYGIPTYWSQYCALNPFSLLTEYHALIEKNITPRLFVDSLTMVTTPYDIAYNRALERINNHGSCGMGFAATIERNLSPNKLYAGDMRFPFVVEQRLKAIATYYAQKVIIENKQGLQEAYQDMLAQLPLEDFAEAIANTIQHISLVHEENILAQYDHLIFEGSQGILLDQDHGFFPHVTRSYTTTRNAMEILKRNQITTTDVYYMTRCYQTRHGLGPMTNAGLPLDLVHTEDETNQLNTWQGNFRRTMLDCSLIRYALQCDSAYATHAHKHLAMTCLDQLPDAWIPYTNGAGMQRTDDPLGLIKKIIPLDTSWKSILTSASPCSSNLHETFL